MQTGRGGAGPIGGWSSQDKGGNKACAPGRQVWSRHTPREGRPAVGEGHTVSPGYEPQGPRSSASSAVTAVQALPTYANSSSGVPAGAVGRGPVSTST